MYQGLKEKFMKNLGDLNYFFLIFVELIILGSYHVYQGLKEKFMKKFGGLKFFLNNFCGTHNFGFVPCVPMVERKNI